MPEYSYKDDYERKWTQKYEGTYTPEEDEVWTIGIGAAGRKSLEELNN